MTTISMPPEPPDTQSAELLPKGDAASSSGVRSLVVMLGPSVLLDSLFAASTAITFGRRVRGPGRRPRPLLRAIAFAGAVAPLIYVLCLRRWVLHWGATEAEANEHLPGDEIIPEPGWQSTRAIDIAAPPSAVWPWLAQMGQNRGGLYSYESLENLAGLDFHNADHIVPEWQAVKVGDFVRFAPDQDSLTVAQVEPAHCLVWRVLTPGTHDVADLAKGSIGADATWSFVLRPTDENHTRLIQRFRFGARPRVLALLYPMLIELPHFIMERRMLQGIRERAQRAWTLS